MKRISALVLMLCVLFAFCPRFGSAHDVADSLSLKPYMTTKVSAEHADCVTCADDEGVSSYTIDASGSVYVTDTGRDNSPIKVYSRDGNLIKSISADLFTDDESGVSAVTCIDDKLYVLTYDGTLCEYRVSSGGVTVHDVPYEILSPSGRGIIPVGRYIVFTSYDKSEMPIMFDTRSGRILAAGCIYSVRYDYEGGTCTVMYDGRQYDIPCESGALIYPAGQDGEGNIIVEYNCGGISYRKYTTGGELRGIAYEDYSDQKYYIGDIIRVHNGDLMRAVYDGERYSVDVVQFSQHSSLRSVPQGCVVPDEITEYTGSGLLFDEARTDRTEALIKADDMINLKWSVVSVENVTDRPDDEITVPAVFNGKKLRGASVNTTFRGIPYCLGGMSGTETAGEQERQRAFTELIGEGATAGNVYYKGAYKPGSAGVDCSGFLSICYGLSEKRQSVWFAKSFGHRLADYTYLRPGDFLVEYDDERHHVMLVYETPETNTSPITVAESTMYANNSGVKINGTVMITRPYSYYRRFIPKTAWHSWSTSENYVCASCPGCIYKLGLRGDADLNGKVNTVDAVWVLKKSAGLAELGFPNCLTADASADGDVNTKDCIYILKYVGTGKWV